MKKRIFALLLAFVMLVGMLPVSVFAAENTVTISNAYCTITPALNYEDDTISYSSSWGGSGDIPRYTVELPSGTQTVTLTLGNSYCLTPDYIDPSIIYYYYTPLTFNTDQSSYESGRSTKVDSYTLLSATESTIELNITDLITSGSLYGVIDSNYTVQYAIEFKYVSSQGPSQEDIPATGITLDKTSVTLNANINETVKLIPTITPDNTTNKTVVWSSSDPNVASVENGVVTAVEGGTATITALCGTVEATCQVTVNRPIYNLNFYNDTDGSYTVVVDSEVDAVASCTPKTTTDQIVIFESDDTDVVTVSQEEVTLNQNGQARVKLRGVAEGVATVTVASKNRLDVKDSVTVNVVSCLHTQKDTTYTHIENTETHTETVTCHNCQKQLSQTTKNCVDTDKNDKCDACDGAVCNHKETTITYQRVENEEKHTVTETCNACLKTVGTPTTENCADEDPKDGKCDKCAGEVEDTSASEPTQDENGVYQISTADQLLWFAKKVNDGEKSLSAKLTADIDLSGKTWTPMTGFAGVFDGGNKTVTLQNASNGLFASVIGTSSKRAEVMNVTVAGSISGGNNVGAIAGHAYYANISRCINYAKVSGTSDVGGIVGKAVDKITGTATNGYVNISYCGNLGEISATKGAGGILGYGKTYTNVEYCYNKNTVSGNGSGTGAGVGGIAGYIQGYGKDKFSTITNCYNLGAISGGSYVGGLIGNMYNAVSMTNCYNAGAVTGSSNVGAIAGRAQNKDTSKASNCYYLAGIAGDVITTDKTNAVEKGTTVKTEAELKDAAMIDLLNGAFQKSNSYPALTWESVSAEAESYDVTAPETAGITFSGETKAFSTEPYTFTVTINDYYRANNSFAVRINNGDPLTAKTVDGKVYTYEIAEPSADMVITVEGVESTEAVIWSGSGKPSVSGYVSNIKIYDVTVVGTPVVNGNTITVTLSEDTSPTEEIRFTVGTGGAAASSMSVTPGKDFVKNLSAGVLEQTITANLYESASWNIKLQVEGEEVEYVDVEKPTSAQYTITGNDTAPKGGSYSFTLKLNSRYMANEEAFAVKANGQKLAPTNGEYTVPNVTEDIHITVEGVEMRTFSGITAGGKDVTAELQGLYTVKQGTWGSESTTPYGNVPYYKVQVPYGTQTVKITYPSYWHPISGGTQGAVTGWAYNPITLANGEPDKGTYTTYGDVAYTTNADGTHTVEVSVNNYLLKNNKGFSLLDNSLGFVDVLTFIVEDCTHPAANIKTTYAAIGNNTHTATQTCLLCNTQVGSITESCTDTDPKDDKCDLCKGDSTVPVVSITLSKTEAKREIGKTLQLAATLLPENATDKTVTWTSSNEAVATVDATGKVTAIAVGETVITAKAGEQEATCTVTVTEVANRVSAYLSISHDADFMVGEDTGTIMVLRQMEVPWFDLTPYGLEKYALPSTDAGYQKPTVLHMYIYATEVYYLGIPADEAGQGQLAESGKQQDLILPGDEPGSMYMKKFWEYDENLRYFYNYTYPAIDGWGITADRLVLSDGDVITLGHHSYWEAHADSGNGFLYFAKEDTKLVNTSVMQNTALHLQLKRSGGGMGNVTTHKSVANTDVYYVKSDALISGNVKTWTKLGTTDANGLLQTTISLTPGTYYLAAAGQAGVQATDKIVSSPGAVILTVLENTENSPVRNVMDLIDAIGEVTLDREEAITAARIAYDALDDQSLQDAVSNYSKLIDAEAKLIQLKKEKEDQDKADAFAAKVDAIGTVEATDTCKSRIDIAKAAYELLSEDQKTLAVEAKAKLDKAESDYTKLIAGEQDNAAADAVEAKITAIGTVTLNSEAAIKEARAAYNALSDTQKTLVENIDVLTVAEKKLAELKDEAAADAVEAKIEAIGEVKLDSEEDINAARTAYDGLTDAQKALVENLSVLEAAEEALELLKLAGTDIAAMYQTTGNYLAGLSAPGVGTTNGEWRVIGLSRADKSVADSYYNAVVKFVQENIDTNNRLHESKSTENSRLIVALTAIGKDVTDVNGYNLLTGLNDMTYIGNQGINGTIWALIAFDTHDYEIPAGNVTREKMVQAIVGKQCSDGGWSLSGVAGDPDITGMALQALAPYYQINSSVKTAVDNALVWLSGIQAKDGTFSCSEGVTSESLAQVITGLTALGINPETDSRFVKNGVSAMDALSKFYLGDGTFEHGLGSGRNMMATEQAYYALVSYYRMLQGKTSLYNMSDVTIETAAKDHEAADAVETLINAIGTVTKNSGEKIKSARDAYEALTDAQKALVENYKTLTDAEKTYAELVKTAEDEAVAKAVEEKIDAIGTVTLNSESKIKEVRKAFDALTDVQKVLVKNYETLTDAEAKYADLVKTVEDESAANTVETLISAIGTVTKNSGDKIKAARDAYDKLTEDQKKLIENYKALTDAEAKFKELNSTAKVTFTLLGCCKHDSDMVHTLSGGNLGTWIAKKTYKVEPGATVKDVLEKALAEAGMDYKNPTGNYVESINGIGEFTNGANSGWMYTLNGTHPGLGVAEQKVKDGDAIVFHYTDDYTKEESSQGFDDRDEAAAEKIEKLIDAIGTVTLDSKDKIDAACKAYDALTYTQKQLVDNYATLTAAESKYAALLKEHADVADKAAAEKIEKQIADIGTVSLDSEDKIKAARAAYDALTDTQKSLVENRAVLEAAEEALALLKLAGTDITKMYQETGSHLAGLSAPGVGTTNGEWRVIGLSRAGKSVADSYYNAVVKFVQENIDENGRLHESKSTDNSRLIVALTAIGKDVTDVGGYDLLSGLDDMTYIGKQGINGTIWALIAFDTHDYEIPAGDVTREKLVKTILDAQKAGGGWALSGTVGDPDMTGMALQALAPYYQINSSVKTAVDNALVWLSGIQAKNGTFSCSEGVTSESLAQVITGLTALGINPETDSRFVKNGVSAMDALSKFYLGDGTFEHGLGSGRNMMATEQAYYALVSYYRMLQGKTSLYNMSDVTIVIPVYKIIEGANSDWQKDDDALTIRADGEFAKFTGVKLDGKLVDSKHYTAKAGSTVITFTTDYLKTLSEGEHTITVVFKDGEAATSLSVLPTDEEAANRVEELIKEIGTVTKDSEKKIKAAKEAYDQLTEEQKKLVDNYKVLTEAEEKLDGLKETITVTFTLLGDSIHGDTSTPHTLSGGGLSTWIGATPIDVKAPATVLDVLTLALKGKYSFRNDGGNYISSINGLAEFTNGANSGWMYTLNGYHPNLGVAEQSVKNGDVIVFHYTDDYTKESGGQGLGDRDEAVAAKAEAVIETIGTVTLESKGRIDAARKAYDALTFTQKKLVGNYDKLTAAESKYAELKKADDEKKADAVEKLIDQLDSHSASFESDVKTAQKAYNELTADQKKLVENYTKLAAALKKLADEEDKEAAEKVEKLIKAIGTVTADSEAQIKAAREAYDQLTDEQKALVENLKVLEAAEEKLAELKKLKNVADIYKSTGDYLEKLGVPIVNSVGGEWMVIGLARSGRNVPEGYYDNVVKFVKENIDENERLHNVKSTENARVILALTAIGKNVTDVDGHNLLSGLNDMDYVCKQGINGPIWALLAFDSGNYPTPVGNVNRDSLIHVILEAQLADGGWALSGDTSDADMTGMALQALAPYCTANADVKAAVEEAIATLTMMQAADGSFASIDGTSSESSAQVITALAALGIDAHTDERFVKNGISALDALCAYYVEGGGFKHIPNGNLDGMATEQSYYALTAYFRMLEEKTALYDMTDVLDMGGDVITEEITENLPVETEPVPTESVEMPAENGRSFPWWLVIVIGVLAGAIMVLVIISKPKKGNYVR